MTSIPLSSSAVTFDTAGTAGLSKAGEANAVAAAKQAVVNANSAVDTDKRDHSPNCVIIDQRLVDKAEVSLAQVQSTQALDTTV